VAAGVQQPCFTAFGQVAKPGKYQLPMADELTISQAIAFAGEFKAQAVRKDVHVIRKVKGAAKPLVLRVDMDAVFVRKEIQHDISIRPGDVIIVKEVRVIW
jgi:polysaccharide biosynthesis/export protein